MNSTNGNRRMHNLRFAVGDTALEPLRKERHPQPAAAGAVAGAAFGALPGPGIFPHHGGSQPGEGREWDGAWCQPVQPALKADLHALTAFLQPA